MIYISLATKSSKSCWGTFERATVLVVMLLFDVLWVFLDNSSPGNYTLFMLVSFIVWWCVVRAVLVRDARPLVRH
jgi:hypothetical protein